jgi:RNA ligase (TIGR02306 family)
MRKLATIRRIGEIYPIEGADAIECAQVDGWKVVVKKGEFQVGQLATYLEVDSWVPEQIAPFLCRDDKEYNGVRGARLRTIKLRGQVSQGLLLPAANDAEEGADVTEVLGIQKYEPPVPAQLTGQVRGNFPSFIPKTDQERIQNLGKELAEWSQQDWAWEVTEKLDGSSMTAYLYQGEFGVCSRNLDLKEDENNSFWKAARANGMEQRLRALGRNLALQGELIGEGIQKNRYAIKGQQFYLFDIYDIDAGRYSSAKERRALNVEVFNLHHCPVISDVWLTDVTQGGLLEEAEGKSVLNPAAEREGLVYKCIEKEVSFKAISNKFLLADKS